MTREPDLYIKLYQKYIRGNEAKTYQSFVVPIGNTKIIENIVFHPEDPVLKYHKMLSNTYCLSSLTSDFHIIDYTRAATACADCIEEK